MIRSIIFVSLAMGLNAQAPDSKITGTDPIEQMVGNVGPTRSIVMKDCGAYCVAIVGSRLKESAVEFATAKSLVDPDGDGLCSMAELVHGLSELGIESVAMESTGDKIPAGLNILHVLASKASKSADHFIVSEQVGDDEFRYYAPPLGARTGSGKEMMKMWGGRFVHIGKVDDTSIADLMLFAGSLLGGCLVVWIVRKGLNGTGV